MPFTAAERSHALLALRAFEHDPDLLFRGELSVSLSRVQLLNAIYSCSLMVP